MVNVTWGLNEGECHVTEVVSLNGGRKVMSEVASLMEGEWLWTCYGGGLFNGGGMVMLQRWAV